MTLKSIPGRENIICNQVWKESSKSKLYRYACEMAANFPVHPFMPSKKIHLLQTLYVLWREDRNLGPGPIPRSCISHRVRMRLAFHLASGPQPPAVFAINAQSNHCTHAHAVCHPEFLILYRFYAINEMHVWSFVTRVSDPNKPP